MPRYNVAPIQDVLAVVAGEVKGHWASPLGPDFSVGKEYVNWQSYDEHLHRNLHLQAGISRDLCRPGENMKPRDIKKLIQDFVNSVPEEIRKEAETKALEKKVNQRMLGYFQKVAELAQFVEPLGIWKTTEEDWQSYQNIVGHARSLWHDACALYHSMRYAPAVFIAIVALEEIGKVSVARIQFLHGDARRKNPELLKTKISWTLRDHKKKHLLAACAGAVINARLDRVLGLDRVNLFIGDVESGRIEQIRQDSVYYELRNAKQHLPYEIVSKEDAKFYVILAGELLAEVGGVGGSDFQSLLDEVVNLEKLCGINAASE